MSFQFNDTTNYKGLVQLFEKEVGLELGTISGDTTKLKQFTADVNSAFDDFVELAIKSSGTWQWDDSNHGDYPIVTTNIVASQRDYAFTTDEQNNLILDIYKVFVKSSSTGQYDEIYPVDVQSEEDTYDFTSGEDIEGIPYRYDKTANGIFLDPVPVSSVTNGLKVYINREASYFTYTDTTRKPGVPGILHDYFYLKPAFDYARRKTLAVAVPLEKEVLRCEYKIAEYFSSREKDVRKRLTMKRVNYM